MQRPGEPQRFGSLLRQLRMGVGLTQEQLAERAGLSRRGIADLERGARQVPYPDTVERLAVALDLSEAASGELASASRPTRRSAALPTAADPSLTTAGPAASVSSEPALFVGRNTELRQLRDACGAAARGMGTLVWVAGEPGIGKTAVCEQLSRYAASLGMCTLVGQCYEERALSVPYLPFIEALRGYSRTRTSEQLRSEFGLAASDVAHVVPDLRDRLDVQPPPTTTPEEDRWRLLSGLSDVFCAISVRQPLLLVLEDLQWADRASLDLLLVLCRRLPAARMLVIGTFRDVEVDRAHPLAAALVELRRICAFARVPLHGLGQEEVRELLVGVTSQGVAAAFAHAVHQRTEGNPLFVEEVARHLVESGTRVALEYDAPPATSVPAADSIPEGLRDVIGRRLNKLSTACNEMLGVASVIGREFGLETLRQVADLDEATLLAALEEAQRARVLDDRSALGAVRFRFSHALFRETLYAELFTPRRLSIHKSVARALERQYASRCEEHAAELAEHFAQSSDAADLDKAVRYAEVAAERATSVSAHSEAARHLRAAIEITRLLRPGDQAKQCDLLLALGYALLCNGQRQAAQEVAPEALRLAEALSDRTRAFHACIIGQDIAPGDRAGFLIPATGRGQTWVDLLDRYAEPGTAERVHADLRVVMRLREAGREDDGRRLNLSALQLARDIGDDQQAAMAAWRLAEGWVEPPRRQQERLTLADEFSPALRDGYRHRLNVSHGAFESMGVFTAGDIYLTWRQRERAEKIWAQLAERAAQTHLPWFTLMSYRTQLVVACLDGAFDRALAVAAALGTEGEVLEHGPFGRASAAAYGLRTRLYVGDAVPALDDFPEHVRQAAPSDVRVYGVTGVLSAQRATCLAYAGQLAEATAVIDRYLQMRQIGAPEDSTAMPIVVALLEAAVLAGDATAAERLATPLSVAAHLVAADNSLTVVARHLGAAMRLLGDHARAYNYSRQALDVASAINFRPEVALAQLQIAELLLDADPQSAEGLRLLERALAEFRTMRMRPALSRALDVLWQGHATVARTHRTAGRQREAQRAAAAAWAAVHDLGSTIGTQAQRQALRGRATAMIPSPAPRAPRRATQAGFGGLTAREQEVAALVAAGKSNREVAEALVLGERTVETHVSRILGRLGFSSRAQIAAWAAERGLGAGH